jgi:hypothetical protein
MQPVAFAFKLQLVLGQTDLVDLDCTQRIGALCRVADQNALLVVAQVVVEIAAP